MDTSSPHILVVDDDRRLRDLLTSFLRENGFRVTAAHDAAEARAKLATLEFDLIVLDVMMPGESGLDLTRSLRETNDVPILMLTAMNDVEDRIAGFAKGVDDYLSKPFEPRELVMRIQAILRRARPPSEPAPLLRFGGFEFDPARLELRDVNGPVRLTAVETRLLTLLAERAGTPVSREELGQYAEGTLNLRSVDVQVTRLRRKIEPDPRVPRYLQTVRGKGYLLQPD